MPKIPPQDRNALTPNDIQWAEQLAESHHCRCGTKTKVIFGNFGQYCCIHMCCSCVSAHPVVVGGTPISLGMPEDQVYCCPTCEQLLLLREGWPVCASCARTWPEKLSDFQVYDYTLARQSCVSCGGPVDFKFEMATITIVCSDCGFVIQTTDQKRVRQFTERTLSLD